MTLTDVLMVLATALSPLIAVRVSVYLDDRSKSRDRQVDVFKTLMATRAYSLSPRHVEALNRIDLEFAGKTPGEKAVRDAWVAYLDHLNSKATEHNQWGVNRLDRLVELLAAMAAMLRYDFNKTQIKNAAYIPEAHGEMESEQNQVRKLVLELLTGERPLAMKLAEPYESKLAQAIQPIPNPVVKDRI